MENSELSEKQKREIRRQRFKCGISSSDEARAKIIEENEKKMRRAHKFGIISKEIIEQKKKDRAKRFGVAPGSIKLSLDEEKKKSRIQRFGLIQKEEKPRVRTVTLVK